MAPEVAKTVAALVDLADAMRAEGLARLTYRGGDFDREAADKIKVRESARLAFEDALNTYVNKLVRA